MTLTEERPDTATAARRAMIDSQLRVSGVNDARVLAAMAAVAREDFVPAAARGHAYIDRAIPLGAGRALAAPLVHGLMLSEARPTAADRILVVTGGCGYLAALIEAMGLRADTIDAAEATVKKGGRSYSLILIDGAIETLPKPLAARLAEGARIVTGLSARGVTRLAVGREAAGDIAFLPLAEIGIPVLPEFAAPKRWSF